MDAIELTLLQRLWDWTQERETSALSLYTTILDSEMSEPRFAVAVERQDGDGVAPKAAWGGWTATLAETLRESAIRLGLPTEVEAHADPAERLAIEMNQVRSALGRVAEYQDLDGPSPIPLLVDELVRDHELIETRLDAILHLMVATREAPGTSQEVKDLIFEVGEIAAGRRDFTDARELTEGPSK